MPVKVFVVNFNRGHKSDLEGDTLSPAFKLPALNGGALILIHYYGAVSLFKALDIKHHTFPSKLRLPL